MKPAIAVHKFASCSGCQLAFINMGEDLLILKELVDIVHFPEAGPLGAEVPVDIAFIEGSVVSPEDVERLQTIRELSEYLVTVGACATSGGIQALKNNADSDAWMKSVYAKPEYIKSLSTSAAISRHVKVDFELWGCPVNVRQMTQVIRQLLNGVQPIDVNEKVCAECKRQNNVCVLVSKGEPCMGPVTRTGCGALCPHFGTACYSCYGPAESINTQSLGQRFLGLGLHPVDIAQKFHMINNAADEFREAGHSWAAMKED
ncbi:MAG: sulfhydrogenase subunit delta [Reinekea sp.]|jgi:sulfhydrogenase subunit delta